MKQLSNMRRDYQENTEKEMHTGLQSRSTAEREETQEQQKQKGTVHAGYHASQRWVKPSTGCEKELLCVE